MPRKKVRYKKRKQGPSSIKGKIDGLLAGFNVGWLMNNIGLLAFTGVLLLVYIGNTHYAGRNKASFLKNAYELKELRWEYMTSKADLMNKSKQTEVAQIVSEFGLKELDQPIAATIKTKE